MLNLKDTTSDGIPFPLTGMSMMLKSEAKLEDLVKLLENVTICLHMGDMTFYFPLSDVPLGGTNGR